jgi:hypothetical protein
MRTRPHRPRFATTAALALLVALSAWPLTALAVNVLPNGGFEYFTGYAVNGVLQKWNNYPEYRAQSWNLHEASGAADLHFMDSYRLGLYIAPAYGISLPNHRVEGGLAQAFGSQKAFSFVFSQTVTVQSGADYALGGKMVTYWKGPGGEIDHTTQLKRIGIDPTGGRAAEGAGVVWTDWDGADDAWRSPALAVTMQATQATLFIQVENRGVDVGSDAINLGYLDGFRFERAPMATLNLPVQANAGSVAVSWSATLPDVAFWALLGYDVEVRSGAGDWQRVQSATDVGGKTQTYALDAAAGQIYSVRVRPWQHRYHRYPAGDAAVPALPGVWVEKQVQVSGDGSGGGGGGTPGSHTVFLPLISLTLSSESSDPDLTPTPSPTPGPSPTPPASSNTFRLKTVRMLTIAENGGCAGNHNVFLSVVDRNGTPLFGPVIGDPPANNFRVTSGDKNEPFFSYGVKTAEITLYSSGTRLKVIENPSGIPVTSDQTPLLSTNTWEIPVEWLIEAGYCTSADNCTGLLCQGHYSYWVVFEAQ